MAQPELDGARRVSSSVRRAEVTVNESSTLAEFSLEGRVILVFLC